MLTVRPALRGDEARVLSLLSQLFERDVTANAAYAGSFRALLDTPRGRVLVAEEDGIVLGVISFSYNLAIRYAGGYAQIEEIVVDEAARGKNAGAALVRACIEAAKANGCDEIGLYPLERSRGFYEKLGFTYAGVELRMPLKPAAEA